MTTKRISVEEVTRILMESSDESEFVDSESEDEMRTDEDTSSSDTTALQHWITRSSLYMLGAIVRFVQ